LYKNVNGGDDRATWEAAVGRESKHPSSAGCGVNTLMLGRRRPSGAILAQMRRTIIGRGLQVARLDASAMRSSGRTTWAASIMVTAAFFT
jgi:hypothetical protein